MFLIYGSGSPFIWRSSNICATLVEVMGNIPVKLFEI